MAPAGYSNVEFQGVIPFLCIVLNFSSTTLFASFKRSIIFFDENVEIKVSALSFIVPLFRTSSIWAFKVSNVFIISAILLYLPSKSFLFVSNIALSATTASLILSISAFIFLSSSGSIFSSFLLTPKISLQICVNSLSAIFHSPKIFLLISLSSVLKSSLSVCSPFSKEAPL